VIRFENVGLRYGLGQDVLRDVSFHLLPGSFHFLTGPSGAGKTSLLRLLFLSMTPSRGMAYMFGKNITKSSSAQRAELRRRIGIVFQDFRLLPAKTVWENVAFALDVTGRPGSEVRRRVPQLLSLVGLQDHAHHLPTELSGGEQQRTAIARALVHDPAILIADEPTGNLDPVTSWEIIQLLIQINQLGTTVLMATHNQEIVNAMRRRVLALEGGRLVRDEAAAAYERQY
jgi:cell division transport system ATP-binding protein